MADTVDLPLKARIVNVEAIIKQIQDAVDQGFLDEKTSKALKKASSRVITAKSFDDAGDSKAAEAALLSVYRTLRHSLENLAATTKQQSEELRAAEDKVEQTRNELAAKKSSFTNHYDNKYIAKQDSSGQYKITSLRNQETQARLKSIAQNQPELANDQLVNYKNWNSAANYLEKTVQSLGYSSDEAQKYLTAAKALNIEIQTDKNGQVIGHAFNSPDIEKRYNQNLTDQKALGASIDQQNKELTTLRADVTGDVTISINGAQISLSDLINKVATGEAQTNQAAKTDIPDMPTPASPKETAVDVDNLTDSTNKYTKAQATSNTTVGKAVTTFFGYQMILRQLRTLWNRAINTITELDKQLTSQAIVTNLTREETWKLVDSYQKLAEATGFTTTEIAGVTTEYLKQGESIKNALTLTEAAAKAAKVAGISATDSVKYLTTAIHGFKLEASDALEVSDKFAALAADSATDYDELAVALSKVASQASLAGISMDYTLALLTTGLDVTQEAGESIGTALKTVIARMREISDYGETLEDNININDVEDALNVIGVKLRDQNGELRSTEDVLDEVGKKWDTLSSNQQAAVAKAMAGTRQQSRLVAILDNYDNVLRYQAEAADSVGATNAQMKDYLQGMEAAQNQITVAFEKFITAFTNNDAIIWIINKGADLLNSFTKFFETASGKVTLFSGLAAILLNLGGFTKVQGAFNGILNTVRQLITGEQQVTAETTKQTAEMQKQTNLAKQKTATTSVDRIVQTQNQFQSSKSSIGPSIANIFNSLFSVGPNWGKRVKSSFQTTGSNIKSTWKDGWAAHNSKKGITTDKLLDDFETTIVETTKKSKEYKEAAAAIDKNLLDENGAAASTALKTKAKETALNNQIYETTGASAAIQKQVSLGTLSNDTQRALESGKMLTDSQKSSIAINEGLTYEQKIAALRKGGASDEEIKKLKITPSAADKGQKVSGVASKISGILSIISGVSMIVTSIKNITTAYNDALEEAVDAKKTEVNSIQSEIYTQAHQRTTLDNLVVSYDKLNNQIVKSTDYMSEMDDVRQDLIDALGYDASVAKDISTQQLRMDAESKSAQLDKDIEKNVDKLSDTLTKASGSVDAFGNITSEAAIWMAAGATIGGGVGTFWGPVGSAIGGAVGGLIGAAGGAIAGGIKTSEQKKAKEDAIGQFNKLLEDDEGVDQVQTLLEYRYKNVAGVSDDQNADIKSTYSSFIESLDADDMKSLFEKFDYNSEAIAASIEGVLSKNQENVSNLNDESSTYAERIKAVNDIYNDMLATVGKDAADQWKEAYAAYFSLGEALGTSVKYADQFGWSLTNISTLAELLGDKSETVFAAIGEALNADGVEAQTAALSEAMSGLTDDEAEAVVKMITNGRDFLDLADDITSAASKVQSVREMQSDWGNKTTTEKATWLNDNSGLFMTDGKFDQKKFDDFQNGADMTGNIASYRADTQAKLLAAANTQKVGKQAILKKYQDELAMTTDPEERKKLEDLIANTEFEIATLNQQIADIPNMFDLSLSDIIDKQQEQISAMKEMYQQQEEDLKESLNNRKEAYQDYFDAIDKAYEATDYEEKRNNLMMSIGQLAAGTDATSQNKVNDLRKQLQNLEDDREKTRREDAQQAVLDNIDDQLQVIEDYYEKFLNNDQAILDSINGQSQAEYLQYLKNSGASDAEIESWSAQHADTLGGVWSENGLYGNNILDYFKDKNKDWTNQDIATVLDNLSDSGLDTTDFGAIVSNWDAFASKWSDIQGMSKDQNGNVVYQLNGTTVTLSATEMDILSTLMKSIQSHTGY